MARATAQIVLYLDPQDGELKAEIGTQGGRRKLEIGAKLQKEIKSSLLGQALREMDERLIAAASLEPRAKREQNLADTKWKLATERARRREEIWARTARNHGKNFANKILKNSKSFNIAETLEEGNIP